MRVDLTIELRVTSNPAGWGGKQGVHGESLGSGSVGRVWGVVVWGEFGEW